MRVKELLSQHRKAVIGTAVALLAVACAVFFGLRALGGGDGGDAVYVQKVSNVNAAGGATTNRYAGVTEAQKVEKIDLSSGETIKQVYVNKGDHVKKGDPLFEYDNSLSEIKVQQAELEIEQLNTTIENDTGQIGELEKARSSSDDPLAISAEIQELQAAIAQAKYDLKLKETELKKLREAVTDPKATAPIDGTIQTINTSMIGGGNADMSSGEGEDASSLEAMAGAGESTTFMTILADGNLRIRCKVSEQNIYEVSTGTPVIVRSRVDDNISWHGTISSVESQPTQDGDEGMGDMGDMGDTTASNYNFYISLDESDGLMLGQHVTVEMDFGQDTAKEGIWLDEGWIIHDNGAAYVWATSKEGGSLEQRSVMLGETDENLGLVQIVQGLENTDYIAWPDESCRKGASTTTELVIPDEGEEMPDGGEVMPDDAEDLDMELEMSEGAEAGDTAVAESALEGEAEAADGGEGA
jgi:HlyD family secretion protein